MGIVAIVVVGVAVLALVYLVMIYNNLVQVKHNVSKAWANIDVLLKQRHDELPKLIETCKQYMKFEQDTLQKVIDARSRVFSARESQNIPALGAAEAGLRASVGSLFALAEQYPAATVAAAPIGLEPAVDAPSRRVGGAADRTTVFGALEPTRQAAVEHAAARAREAGVRVETVSGPASTVLERADVIVALDWPPPAGPPIAALAGMAAGKAVLVFETLVTAGWPALDPQTWTPRGFGASRTSEPIAISIDPRDEEHSLMLAMKRLAADAGVRDSLGRAGHDWWRQHATIRHAIEAWRRILSAPGLPPSPPFAGADGTDHARGVLAAFGVSVDFL